MTHRRRAEGDRGAVLILTAILLPVLLLMTSFAVDLGQQRAARRTAQAKADVIALDLSRLINGSTANVMNQPSFYATALNASAARNGYPIANVKSVEFGTLDGNKDFASCPFDCTATAVKVTTTQSVDYVFKGGGGSVTRSAVGIQDAEASFSVGSFAAALKSANGSLLGQLLNDALDVNVLSYTGLASTSLTYLQIANQLNLATPSELFTSNLSAFDFFTAAAQVLQRGGANAAEVSLLQNTILVPNSVLKNVTLGDLAHVEAGGEDAALGSSVNLFDLLATGAFVANGNGLDLPSTLINVAGTTFSGKANLIQGPVSVTGPVGSTTPKTSQVGLTGTISIKPLDQTGLCQTITSLLGAVGSLVSNLLSLLTNGQGCGVLNLSRQLSVEVNGTIDVNLAAAVGTSTRIACPSDSRQLDVAVRSDLITSGTTFEVLLKSKGNTLLDIPVYANTPAGTANSSVTFTVPPDAYGAFKSTTPGSIGLNVPVVSGGFGGLETLIEGLVNPLIAQVTQQLNAKVVGPLSNALGLRVAGADVAANSISCTAVKLAG